jgi:hypothetical protein
MGGKRFNALMTSNIEHKLDAKKQLQYVTKLVTGFIFRIAMLTRIHFKVKKNVAYVHISQIQVLSRIY